MEAPEKTCWELIFGEGVSDSIRQAPVSGLQLLVTSEKLCGLSMESFVLLFISHGF